MQFTETIRVNTTAKYNRIVAVCGCRIKRTEHIRYIKPSGRWGWGWEITYYPTRPKFYVIVFENDFMFDKKVHNTRFAKRKEAIALAQKCMMLSQYNHFSTFTIKTIFPMGSEGVKPR